MILAGRRINDGMGGHVARQLVAEMGRRGIAARGGRILVMGLAFKENTPDLRNSRVIDIVQALAADGARVDIWDPWIASSAARVEYGLELISAPEPGVYDGIVLAVAHREFVSLGGETIRGLGKPTAVLFDVKAVLPTGSADLRL